MRPLLIALIVVTTNAPAHAQAPSDEPWCKHPEAIDEAKLYRMVEKVAAQPVPAARSWPRWDGTTEPERLGDVRGLIEMTSDEDQALRTNGFVVPQHQRSENPVWAYGRFYTADLPIMVTMDSLFWAVAVGYDGLVRAVEQRHVAPEMAAILKTMHESAQLDRDADLYLTIARSLLSGDRVAPFFAANAAKAKEWIDHIVIADEMKVIEIFGRARRVDFSMFQARGNYVGDDDLARVFRAITWLTRFELNLASRDCRSSHPGELPDTSETPREASLATTLARLAKSAGVLDRLDRVSAMLDTLVAPRADVPTAWLARQPHDPAALIAAIGQSYKRHAPTHPMPPVHDLPVVWTMLGLRTTESTGALGGLLLPNVPERTALSGSDVAVLLGHEGAKRYLGAELAQMPNLGPALVSSAKMFSDLGPPDTLRAGWLQAILAGAKAPRGVVPSFTKTAAYDDLRINTALVAYARLRRSTIAYEAGSFQWSGCDVPDGYVEPAPDTLTALVAYAQLGQAQAKRFDPDKRLGVANYFGRLERVFVALRQIVRRQLVGAPLSRAEREFLHQIVETHEPSYEAALQFDGWYMDLFFDKTDYVPRPDAGGLPGQGIRLRDIVDVNVPDGSVRSDMVIDVATTAIGNDRIVSHLGATTTRWGVFVVDAGGPPRALIGPVSLGYAAPSAARLTDADGATLAGSDRTAPWTRSFAPWFTRVDKPWPNAMLDVDCVEAAECRTLRLRFQADAALGKVEVRLHDRRGGLIGKRTIEVAKGQRSVTLDGGPELRERMGYLALRRGDSERLFTLRSWHAWESEPEFPLEFGLGALAHDGDDDAGMVDDEDALLLEQAYDLPVKAGGK